MALMYSYLSHTGHERLSNMMLVILGCCLGVKHFWIIQVEMKRDCSYPWLDSNLRWEILCVNTPQGFLLLMCVTSTLRKALTVALQEEGNQLDHGTVRNARCSVQDDEDRLKLIIRGSEDDIDYTIRTLMRAGKYNRGVELNLHRGMSAWRIMFGVRGEAVAAGCCSWVFVISVGCLRDFQMTGNPMAWRVVLAVMLSSSFLVICVSRLLGDWGIFATDVLFWSGVGAYVLQFFTDLFAGAEWYCGRIENAVLICVCILPSVWACGRFYLCARDPRRKAGGKPTLTFDESEEEFSSDSSDGSGGDLEEDNVEESSSSNTDLEAGRDV